MDCIKDFTSREVRPEEVGARPGCGSYRWRLIVHVIILSMFVGLQSTCSESCLQKYLKMTQRISMRFQEYHIQQNEALAAKAGLLAQPR